MQVEVKEDGTKNIAQYGCVVDENGKMTDDTQKFYLEPVVETTDENIKIEARVIFGDYNDDGTHEYADVNPKLQLRYRSGNSFPHNVDGQVQANLVVDNSVLRWNIKVYPLCGKKTFQFIDDNFTQWCCYAANFDANDLMFTCNAFGSIGNG